ncbi:MAG TPA: enoyl-CoA hydratase/isomerase family protein [Dehalococcoidia bacterium]|nr:enoyl-CoA hydratase/isomerase family protein [Dehalococcoidia bacterium]
MTDYTHVQTHREGPALVATLTNPPRNLMNALMVRELTDLAESLANVTEARVLVLTGVGDIFITHYDVSELTLLSDRMQGATTVPANGELHGTHKAFLKLQSLPQVVIAAMNGTAMGGGCELSLDCDFLYMARGPGRIGLPEVRVGILPGAGGTQRMARLLGTARAMELMLLGDAVDADTAERIGLVHKACDPDQLMPEVLSLANELAKRPPLSIALIKQCVLRGVEMPLDDALHFEQDAFWQTMRSPDAARLMREYLTGNVPLDKL